MNLVKLQAELRGLQSKLLWLENEIEGMKSRESEEYKEIYEKITSLAKRHIIRNQTLQKAGQEVKEGYIGCLSYLSLIEKGISKHKLLFLTRLALGLDRSYTTEVVVEYGLKFGNKDLGESLMRLKNRKLDLILDALILANMGEERKMGLSFVADMAYLLGASKEELKVISKVAKAVLENRFDILDEIELTEEHSKWQGMYAHYIPEEWLISRRLLCQVLEEGYKWKGKLKQNQYIMRGEIITSSYEYKGKSSVYSPWRRTLASSFGAPNEEVTAPKAGVVYYKNRGNASAYIANIFDDPSKVKEWMEKKHK